MATIEELEQLITQLEETLKVNGLRLCPLCGGTTRLSTRFPGNEFCQQDNGHCGEWVLHQISPYRRNGDWPKSFFSRTHIKEGKVMRLDIARPFKRIVFVAGKEIDIDPAAQGN